MNRETMMYQVKRDRETDDRIRKMDTHEIVDLVHSHEDEIYRLCQALEDVEEYLKGRSSVSNARLLEIVCAALEKARQ